MKKVRGDIEILFAPLGVLLLVIIIMGVSAKVIFDNIARLNQDLANNQKTENMLKLKLTSLQTVDPNLSTQSEAVIFALPGSNSVLDAVSQVQNQATGLHLGVSNIDSENGVSVPGSEINSSDLTFNADGDFQSITSFIDNIKKSTPISIFDTIKITNQSQSGNNTFRLTATLTSYWALLPKTIPAITEPIEKLTVDENKILNQISSLTEPVNLPGSATSSVAVGKTNPFQ